jgi:tight adherence protein B
MRRIVVLLLILTIPFPVASGNEPVSRNSIVLLDTSGSMRGSQLDRAKEHILETLNKRETDSEFEIYTFAEEISPISTKDKSDSDLQVLVSGISAGSRTSLYDSIAYLIPIAKSAQADIIVLSDGDDSESKFEVTQLLNILSEANVRVFFLSDYIDPRFLASVENIVQSSGGDFLDAIPLRPIAKVSPPTSAPLTLALGTGLLSYLFGVKFLRRAENNRQRSQDKKLLMQVSEGVIALDEPRTRLRLISRKLSVLFNLYRYLTSTRQKLVFFFLSISSWILLLFVTKNWFATSAAVVLGSVIALRSKAKRTEDTAIRAFEKELPGALKMLAGSLSAGLSFLQALSAYAEDGQGVSAREFRRALTEIQLGIPIERALESVATRMKSEDLRWAVAAFAIQREVGGSLATILNSTAETIESRFELRREVRTLSAEGRISSYILMALPIGIFLFLSFLRPDYVGVFLTEPVGNLLLIGIVVALIAAWFWLRNLVRIST